MTNPEFGGDHCDIKLTSAFVRQLDHAWAGKDRYTDDEISEFVDAQLAFAKRFSPILLRAYGAGELDLVQALHWAGHVSGACSADEQRQIVGDIALRAIALGRPKLLNSSKPRYPTAVKEFAVDLVLALKELFPGVPMIAGYARPRDSIIGLAVVALAIFGICPPPPRPGAGELNQVSGCWDFAYRNPLRGRERLRLSEPTLSIRTLHRWYLDHRHLAGQTAKRGRPRQESM